MLKIKDEVYKLAINKIMSLLKSNNNNQEWIICSLCQMIFL